MIVRDEDECRACHEGAGSRARHVGLVAGAAPGRPPRGWERKPRIGVVPTRSIPSLGLHNLRPQHYSLDQPVLTFPKLRQQSIAREPGQDAREPLRHNHARC